MHSDKTVADINVLVASTLPANDLTLSAVVTAAYAENTLRILGDIFAEIGARVEGVLGRRLCVICFGSLARFEYAPRVSDLDFMIVVDGGPVDGDLVRALVLPTLAANHPWLVLDERDLIVIGKLSQIPNKDLKYAVLSRDEFPAASGNGDLMDDRRWQVLLESRCLYGVSAYDELYRALLPDSGTPFGAFAGSLTTPTRIALLADVSPYLRSFDNPQRLHKNPAKYWKIRFLREAYQYANMIGIMLGAAGTAPVSPKEELRAATLIKLAKLHAANARLDVELSKNPNLDDEYCGEIEARMNSLGIDRKTVLVGGERYKSATSVRYYGLINALLLRYLRARELLYHPQTQMLLASIPKETPFDSRFGSGLSDPSQRALVEELHGARMSYLRYMAACTTIVRSAMSLTASRSFPPQWNAPLDAFAVLPPW
jgi:hypothetical protein